VTRDFEACRHTNAIPSTAPRNAVIRPAALDGDNGLVVDACHRHTIRYFSAAVYRPGQVARGQSQISLEMIKAQEAGKMTRHSSFPSPLLLLNTRLFGRMLSFSRPLRVGRHPSLAAPQPPSFPQCMPARCTSMATKASPRLLA
jgi:hypothetical protein